MMRNIFAACVLLVTFSFGNECEYPLKFKFNDEQYYPVMTTTINDFEHPFKELLLKNSKDQYIALLKGLPAIFTVKKNNLKKIILNEDLMDYTFKKEVHKEGLLVKEYSNSSNDTLLFIFNKKDNDLLGSLAVGAIDKKTKSDIIKSLVLNKKNCTKEEYWDLYLKTKPKEFNKKLKLLYSLYLLNTVFVDADREIKKEIIKVLNHKRKIIEMAIKDLEVRKRR